MPGILDFLKKPAVQDAAVTAGAAASFGPLALLAYPFLRDDRKRADADLDARREETLTRRRLREAQDSVPQLLSGGGDMTDAERRAEVLRTGSIMAPQIIGGAMAQSVLPPQRTKPPALIALADDLQAANPELGRVEALEQASQLQNRQDPNAALETESLLTRLATQRAELQEMLDERQAAEEQKAEQERNVAWKLEDTAVNIQEMTDALDTLEGSPLRPGFFFNDIVKGGFDVAQLITDAAAPDSDAAKWLEKQRTAYSDFDKNSKLFVRNYLDAFMARGGTVTRDIQRLTEESSPNQQLSVDTIKTINALAAKDILRRDETNEVKISSGDRRQLEKLIRSWESGHKNDTPEFSSPMEAQAAVNAGLIEEGSVVTVDGQKFKAWKD